MTTSRDRSAPESRVVEAEAWARMMELGSPGWLRFVDEAPALLRGLVARIDWLTEQLERETGWCGPAVASLNRLSEKASDSRYSDEWVGSAFRSLLFSLATEAGNQPTPSSDVGVTRSGGDDERS